MQNAPRMLQVEHSAILSTFIKLLFVIKIFVLSIFEWPFYTGFTVIASILMVINCHIFGDFNALHLTIKTVHSEIYAVVY